MSATQIPPSLYHEANYVIDSFMKLPADVRTSLTRQLRADDIATRTEAAQEILAPLIIVDDEYLTAFMNKELGVEFSAYIFTDGPAKLNLFATWIYENMTPEGTLPRFARP